jgi:hypothetical protein
LFFRVGPAALYNSGKGISDGCKEGRFLYGIFVAGLHKKVDDAKGLPARYDRDTVMAVGKVVLKADLMALIETVRKN